MKISIFLFILMVHLNNVNSSEFKMCLKEHNISNEEYLNLKKIEDMRVGCILACIMTKKRMMKGNVLVPEEMKKHKYIAKKYKISMRDFEKLVDGCTYEAMIKSEKCERALQINVCLKRNLMELSPQSTTSTGGFTSEPQGEVIGGITEIDESPKGDGVE